MTGRSEVIGLFGDYQFTDLFPVNQLLPGNLRRTFFMGIKLDSNNPIITAKTRCWPFGYSPDGITMDAHRLGNLLDGLTFSQTTRNLGLPLSAVGFWNPMGLPAPTSAQRLAGFTESLISIGGLYPMRGQSAGNRGGNGVNQLFFFSAQALK